MIKGLRNDGGRVWKVSEQKLLQREFILFFEGMLSETGDLDRRMKDQLARVEQYIRRAKVDTHENHNIIIERTNASMEKDQEGSVKGVRLIDSVEVDRLKGSRRANSPARMEKSYQGREWRQRTVVPQVNENVRGRDEEYNYYIKLQDPPVQRVQYEPPKTPKVQTKLVEYQPPPEPVKVVHQQYSPAFSLAIKPEPKPILKPIKTEVVEPKPVYAPPPVEEFCECCSHCRQEQASKPKQKLQFYNFMKEDHVPISKVAKSPKPSPIDTSSPKTHRTYYPDTVRHSTYYPLNRHSVQKPYYHDSPDRYVNCQQCQIEREKRNSIGIYQNSARVRTTIAEESKSKSKERKSKIGYSVIDHDPKNCALCIKEEKAKLTRKQKCVKCQEDRSVSKSKTPQKSRVIKATPATPPTTVHKQTLNKTFETLPAAVHDHSLTPKSRVKRSISPIASGERLHRSRAGKPCEYYRKFNEKNDRQVFDAIIKENCFIQRYLTKKDADNLFRKLQHDSSSVSEWPFKMLSFTYEKFKKMGLSGRGH